MEDDDVRGEEVAKVHISKRARYNKTAVVVFDDEARKEFLSGFRKRKNKRRQVAAEQNQIKERQKRLQDRKERRQALKEAKEESSKGEEGEATADGNPEQEEDEEEKLAEAADIGGTVTYDDRETMTVVNVTPINPEDENVDGVQQSGDSSNHSVRSSAEALKVKKPKFKKPKKPQSEKRTRKLTRREKSVPRNMRTKKRKRK